ncbi:MAG: trp operon repressor [Treponema sp.]|nr:trp operon repressor [Treponema sp.]
MRKNNSEVEKNLAELAEVITQAGDPVLVKDFFHCLLTPAETVDIAARWALVKALDQKIPQREIAQQLGLSLCKITRGSRELRKPDSAFRKMLALRKNSSDL